LGNCQPQNNFMPLFATNRDVLRAELRTAFTASLPVSAQTEPHLRGALQQTLAHPGSLVRAQLVFDMASAYGIPTERAKKLAVAIEYFHTASLLFDDLPCMDDATQRRGKPCVHRSHGEAAAVLAALGLINRAYALLWIAFAGAATETQTEAGAYVEKCLGIEGVLNGQSQDLHYATQTGKRPTPQEIATGKTVTLIRLSLVLPALLGGAKPEELKNLERLSAFWGLSYQILDDLKDIFQLSEQTGKTPARDASLHRPNLALAIGAHPARRRLERLLRLGDCALNRLLAGLPALSFLTELRGRFRNELLAFNSAQHAPA
jgi:geranylgeranyl pyrophosphate synthase